MFVNNKATVSHPGKTFYQAARLFSNVYELYLLYLDSRYTLKLLTTADILRICSQLKSTYNIANETAKEPFMHDLNKDEK